MNDEMHLFAAPSYPSHPHPTTMTQDSTHPELSRDLHERAMDYAVRLAALYARLPAGRDVLHFGMQALRAGTSVGAQLREGRRSRSRAEFISKLESATQEADEASFWLELLVRAGHLDEQMAKPIRMETDQIIAMLVSAVRTAKRNAEGRSS